MKSRISILLALLVTAACSTKSSRPDSERMRATSVASGLEEVTILARGME